MKGLKIVLIYSCVIFHCMNIPHIFHLLYRWWHFACFQDSASTNCAAINMGEHLSLWYDIVNFMGKIPSRGIVGLNATSNPSLQMISILISSVAVRVYPQTKSEETFFFLCSLANICYGLISWWQPFFLRWGIIIVLF